MQVPGEVPEVSGAASYLMRFWRVEVKMRGEVPEGSGANTL